MDLSALGRWLIMTGCGIALLGILLVVAGRIPFLGRLPGDIVIKRDHFTVYVPVVTCLLLSLLLTLLAHLLGRK